MWQEAHDGSSSACGGTLPADVRTSTALAAAAEAQHSAALAMQLVAMHIKAVRQPAKQVMLQAQASPALASNISHWKGLQLALNCKFYRMEPRILASIHISLLSRPCA